MHCDFVFCNAWIPSVVTYADKVEAPDGPKGFSLVGYVIMHEHIHLVISQPSLRGRRRRRGHRIGMARRGKLKESRRRETCLVCTRGQYPSLSLNCSSHQ